MIHVCLTRWSDGVGRCRSIGVKRCLEYWSDGVLEYWVWQKPNQHRFPQSLQVFLPLLHHSTTPPLNHFRYFFHHSTTPLLQCLFEVLVVSPASSRAGTEALVLERIRRQRMGTHFPLSPLASPHRVTAKAWKRENKSF